MNKTITIEALIDKDLATVWDAWNGIDDIKSWAHASDDWECPYAENNPVVGGKFLTRMSAKDGSASFDFNGTYTDVQNQKYIAYTIEGGRTVAITFVQTPEGVKVTETFEMEDENPEEMQRAGWQAILDNFKKYTELN